MLFPYLEISGSLGNQNKLIIFLLTFQFKYVIVSSTLRLTNLMDNLPTTFIQTQPQDELSLPPKLHQAARLMSLGFKNREICEKLGMSESHLSIVSKSPLFKDVVHTLMNELDDAAKLAQTVLVESAPKAAEVLVDIMRTTQHDGLKRLVALDLLKGSGAIKSESSSPSIVVNLTENKMNIILETIQQIRGGNGGSKKID